MTNDDLPHDISEMIKPFRLQMTMTLKQHGLLLILMEDIGQA